MYIFFFIKGDEDSFLFSLYPEMRVCESTGYNSHFQYLNIQQQTLPNGLVSLIWGYSKNNHRISAEHYVLYFRPHKDSDRHTQ